MRSFFLLFALLAAVAAAHAKTPDQLRSEFIDQMVSKHGFSRSAVTRTPVSYTHLRAHETS